MNIVCMLTSGIGRLLLTYTVELMKIVQQATDIYQVHPGHRYGGRGQEILRALIQFTAFFVGQCIGFCLIWALFYILKEMEMGIGLLGKMERLQHSICG